MKHFHPQGNMTRREALRTFANGFGMLGLAGVMNSEAAAATPSVGHLFRAPNA